MIAREMIAEKVFAESVAKDIRNFLFVYWILLICNRHINTTPIMPPTNTPQINFNIVTFSFFIFWGFQGFSLTSCRRTDKQKTCVAIQRRCLLVFCILLHPSHCSWYQKIYLPKKHLLFLFFQFTNPANFTQVFTLCASYIFISCHTFFPCRTILLTTFTLLRTAFFWHFLSNNSK